jgi:5'-phosphate synthase pdxT subunit
MDIEINRNYYGRQKDSFEASITLENKNVFNGVFIRAPVITSVGEKATVVAWKGEEIVGCIEGKNMALTFHPELTSDLTFHKMWKDRLK